MLPLDLFLVRHGEAVNNKAIREYEKWLKLNWFLRLLRPRPFAPELLNRHHSRSPLTDKGREQCLVVGDWLTDWLKEKKLPHFDRHIVSSHTRTLETAALLGLPDAKLELDFRCMNETGL